MHGPHETCLTERSRPIGQPLYQCDARQRPGATLVAQASRLPLSRSGLSRTEVIIAVCVVALLAANALPALQSVREAARRQQCRSNLRALGAGLHAYHDTYSCLPPACFWNDAERIIDADRRPMRSPDTVKASRANWVQLLLPALGRDDVSRQFDDR